MTNYAAVSPEDDWLEEAPEGEELHRPEDWTDNLEPEYLDDGLESPAPALLTLVAPETVQTLAQRLEVNADIYRRVFTAVAKAGYNVVWHAGWETRTASQTLARIVPPTSVCVHHTASNNTSTNYIKNGDPARGLTGPLANVHITRDGVVHVLGVGYQNHAGMNDRSTYDRITKGTAPLIGDIVPGPDSAVFSANRYMMALEVNGDGGEDDFTRVQYGAVVVIASELHKVSGWSADNPRIGAHKELTTRKPSDPVASMGRLRTVVRQVLLGLTPPTEQPGSGVPTGPSPRVDFRFGQANLQAERFGGLDDSSSARGKYLRDKMKCSVYALCEVTEEARNAIRKVLGADRYKVYPLNYVCVLWDSTKWIHSTNVKRCVYDNKGVQGAIRVTLTRRDSSLTMDVISVHVRPAVAILGDAADVLDAKKADIAKAAALWRKGVPTILAGDFNTKAAEEVLAPLGFVRGTPLEDTSDAPGDQALDAVFYHPGTLEVGSAALSTRKYAKIDPGKVSDHKTWVWNATISTITDNT